MTTRTSTKTPKKKAGTSAAARGLAARMPRARNAQPLPEPSEPPIPLGTEGLDGALAALSLALDKKALEPVLLDVRRLCSFCNYQLILSGRSDRQVDAIADGISAGLRDQGITALGKEGAKSGQWSLLDFGDFVVHVFVHSARENYDLEGLWNDAPRVQIDVPDDARVRTVEPYA
ncbi:MAG: ribosome silencing factor [Kofleriaceae bacterium]